MEIMVAFNQIYKNKKVLITGHTGFKGSWLTNWLLNLGSSIVGYSKNIPSEPSLFEILNLKSQIRNIIGDINDYKFLSTIYKTEKPDYIFHLAAQPIVSLSKSDPTETIKTNAIGTMNLLEVLRIENFNCITVFVTSDKSYDNIESVWGYRENDQLGGKDIYSGSKGAAELIIKSYFHTFFLKNKSKIRIAVGRAGNVIGGGDWAKDRLIPDIFKSWSRNKLVTIRNPIATRPWQHVLEPLSGYLRLGQILSKSSRFSGNAYNFGPYSHQIKNVGDLLNDLSQKWKFKNNENNFYYKKNSKLSESTILKLNCDKALSHLNWVPNLNYQETIDFVSDWYVNYYKGDIDMSKFTNSQLNEYINIAKKNKIPWLN